MKVTIRVACFAALAALFLPSLASAQGTQRVKVTITNNAPVGGVALTPVWVGFHSGNFDSYNGGLTALEGLERIAEDGATSLLSQQFNDVNANGGYTYIDNSGPSPVSALVRTGDDPAVDMRRQDATLGSPVGPPPLQPGESVDAYFDIFTDGANEYFSYVSMVLPSNDFFVANGSPVAHSLASLYDGEGSISFNIGGFNASPVNDAGTEAESYLTSAANGLFGLAGGQTGPDQGPADANDLIRNVTGPNSLDALNFDEGPQPLFDFNNGALYGNGIATITITAVPEPASAAVVLMGLAATAATTMRRRLG